MRNNYAWVWFHFYTSLKQRSQWLPPLLGYSISKNKDGSLSHSMFWKKTHTKQYLHVDSHHFPAQKLGVLNTLTTHALRISDNKNFDKEKSHLLNVFVKNGYSRHLGHKAFLKAYKNSVIRKEPKERLLGVHLPYV